MWWILEVNGVNGNKDFYVKSEVCVRLCRQESDWFRIKRGYVKGLLWLHGFIMFFGWCNKRS